MVMSGGGHLGPHEPGEFAGDCGDDDLAVVLSGVEAAELGAQALLGGPRPGNDGGVEPGLAAGDLGAGGGPVLVGPRRLDELGAQMGVAGMGDPAPRARSPDELSDGTSPQNPMNMTAVGKRRQSHTSDANVNAPSSVIPR